MDIVLEGIVGSRAFRTARPDSDTDYLGAFVMPIEQLVGLFPPNRELSYTDASPEGDDHTYHELGKLFQLWLKGSPTQLDLLFLDEYTTKTEAGSLIVENRHLFLSDIEIRSKAMGFMNHMMKMNTLKSRYHAVRVYHNTLDLLGWGEYDVGANGSSASGDVPLDYIEECIGYLRDFPSSLPKEPDYGKVNNLLLEIRLGDR